MSYLVIQNPGVAPIEGFTLLGVSTTRDCGVEGTIGQFGSGNKHAINVLLRAGRRSSSTAARPAWTSRPATRRSTTA